MKEKKSVRTSLGSLLAYWMIMIAVGAAMATGFSSFLVTGMGEQSGWIAGTMLAFAIEWLFANSILRWRQWHRPGALLCALILGTISIVADAPVIFRVIRGHELTGNDFETQRNAATRDIIAVREQLNSAAATAGRLANYSHGQAEEEVKHGNTCEKSNGIVGPRTRFRQAEEKTFQVINETVGSFSKRLDDAVAKAQALKPETGEALRATQQRLDAAIATAYSLAQDPGLAAIAGQLEARVKEDADLRRDPISGEAFHCPDPMIRQAAASMAQQLRHLPEPKQRPPVADITNPNTAMVELPVRLIATWRSGVGSPGALGGPDLVALIIATILELLLVIAVSQKNIDRPLGEHVREAVRGFEGLPVEDLLLFTEMLQQAGVGIQPLFAMVDRYRLRFWPFDVIVVAHGTDKVEFNQIGHVMATLSAVGWARRYYLIPRTLVALAAWRRWPEMRGASSREVFRVRLAAFDQLRLAELRARMRRLPQGPIIDLEPEPAEPQSPSSPASDDDTPRYKEAAE